MLDENLKQALDERRISYFNRSDLFYRTIDVFFNLNYTPIYQKYHQKAVDLKSKLKDDPGLEEEFIDAVCDAYDSDRPKQVYEALLVVFSNVDEDDFIAFAEAMRYMIDNYVERRTID